MLPAAASLQQQGANRGATTAFLIATPESGVDSIAVSYALLDPILTVVRPIAALVTAITAGIIENTVNWRPPQSLGAISRNCPVDGCCDGLDCPDEVHNNHHSLMEKLWAGLRFAIRDVWGDIALWFFIGLLVAALITVMVPSWIMEQFLGGGLGSMLIMLVIGIPLYICASASTPIAAALILKGVSPGAALVFLLAGPATNITSLTVLIRLLGRQGTIRYLLVLSLAAVAFGLGVDALYSWLGISPRAVLGEAAEFMPESVKMIGAILLILLSIQPVFRFLRQKFFSPKSTIVYHAPFPSIPAARPKAHADHGSDCQCGK